MEKQKNKFRASWTVLNQWASGNYEGAVKSYFKLDQFVTPAMIAGREYHEKWSEYIKTNKRLPLELGGKYLVDPISEEKKVVNLDTWLEFVFIIDCYDADTLYEFKTGKTNSENYASTMQIPIYAVGATYSGLLIKKGQIFHYDQYLKKTDMSIIWVTDKMLLDAHNWITTLAGEMHNYFLVNRLYERFGKKD